MGYSAHAAAPVPGTFVPPSQRAATQTSTQCGARLMLDPRRGCSSQNNAAGSHAVLTAAEESPPFPQVVTVPDTTGGYPGGALGTREVRTSYPFRTFSTYSSRLRQVRSVAA